jgi:hypothetical protein
VSKDGQIMHISDEDKMHGTTTTFNAEKK